MGQVVAVPAAQGVVGGVREKKFQRRRFHWHKRPSSLSATEWWKKVAHGVSRGISRQMNLAPDGAEEMFCVAWFFCRSCRSLCGCEPPTHSSGCGLLPRAAPQLGRRNHGAKRSRWGWWSRFQRHRAASLVSAKRNFNVGDSTWPSLSFTTKFYIRVFPSRNS